MRCWVRVVAAATAAGAVLLGAWTPSHAIVTGIGVFACPIGISVFVSEDDPSLPAPQVDWATTSITPAISMRARLVGVLPDANIPAGRGRQFIYWNEVALPPGAQGQVIARGERNESYATFVVSSSCPPLGSVRGVAFEDRNRNGVRDPDEPPLAAASWKLTAGGDWYVCGDAGGDGTFGPTVKPGTFTLIPVARPGWRATTPPRVSVVKQLGFAALGNDIGFVRDPSAPGDACDQQSPPLPVPTPSPVPSTPMPQPGDTWQKLIASGRYGYLNDTPELRAVLEAPGAFTFILPTTEAWNRLGVVARARLQRDPARQASWLRAHTIPAAIDPIAVSARGSVFRSLSGRRIVLRERGGDLLANNVRVQEVIATENGFVLVVDRALFLP